MDDGSYQCRPEPLPGLMASRRSVLIGAAAVPVATIATPAWGAIAGRPGPVRAVVDADIEQGAAFADRIRDRKGEVFAYTGDMAGLWFDRLLPALRVDRGPLVGLTGMGALFCFEQLAWGEGMRVRLSIGHAETGASFRHSVAGFPRARLMATGANGADFGANVADFVLDSHPLWTDRTHAPAVEAGALASWVIAPSDMA